MPGISRRQFNASLLAAGGMAAGMTFLDRTPPLPPISSCGNFTINPPTALCTSAWSKCGPR